MYFYYFLNHNSYQCFQVKATSISKLTLRPTFLALLRLIFKFSLFTHNEKLWTKSFGSHILAIFAVFVCLTSASPYTYCGSARFKNIPNRRALMAVLIDPHGDSAGDRDSGDSAGCQRPDGMLAL